MPKMPINFPALEPLWQELNGGKRVIQLNNLSGSARAFFLALLFASTKHPFLIIVANETQEKELYQDLSFFLNPNPYSPKLRKNLFLFPNSGSSGASNTNIISQRIEVLDRLANGPEATILAPVSSLAYKVYPKRDLISQTTYINQGDIYTREALIELAISSGYERMDLVEEPGEFSVRGGIIDIFPPAQPYPIRIELLGDEIDSLREFDPETQKSIHHINQAKILPVKEFPETSEERDYLFDYLPNDTFVILIEPELIKKTLSEFLAEKGKDNDSFDLEEFYLYLEGYRTLEISELDLGEENHSYQLITAPVGYYRNRFSDLAGQLKQWQKDNYRIFLVCLNKGQAVRLKGLMEAYNLVGEMASTSLFETLMTKLSLSNLPPTGINPITITMGKLSSGFNLPELKIVFLVEDEIFGIRKKRPLPQKIKKELSLSTFSTLQVNDYVVHIDYGIGQYLGITKLETAGMTREFLELEYAEGDKLYVPVERLNLIQRYLAAGPITPRLDKLGHNAWKKLKKKVKEELRHLAQDLLNLYATREVASGFAFSPDNHMHQEFDSLFEYEETPHQLQAILDVKADMEKPEPMDRLVCGDVGYGKTEVAMRAAFKAVMDNKQVAVLVPTTILAQQHLQTFQQRFAPYPVNIEMLSRFKSRQEQSKIIQGIKTGLIDIIIGTHRLLQKDVQFKDLGLLIIDEEQRFGVVHKERLKQLRKNVDVLTLTATPIPRTLYLSLSGIRDISIIETPPEDRLPIQTVIKRFSPGIIKEAIEKELERNGQVFFVHNRIESIGALKKYLQKLVPQARIEIAHGQMPERELERVMLRFLEKEFDILLSTSIIESGLDIPSVNTIIINRADRFGLADLYQLRGRVGRDRYQAYAYLLVPSETHLSSEARKRLQAIKELSQLGSGFQLASRDMEIRGSGNILGSQQSGHITAVGFELYCRLLGEAVKELKGERKALEEVPEPEIVLPIQGYIPEDYISHAGQRLDIYKRLSDATEIEGLSYQKEELEDRFGPLPEPLKHLFTFLEIKLLAKKIRLERLEKKGEKMILTFSPQAITLVHQKLPLNEREVIPLQWIDNNCLVVKLPTNGEQVEFIKRTLQALDGYAIVRIEKESKRELFQSLSFSETNPQQMNSIK
jgi:transcription-repair coupling factor (superfamily II helicase)